MSEKTLEKSPSSEKLPGENIVIMTPLDIANILSEFHVPIHVRRHCVTVAELAFSLAQNISRAGHPVDAELVRRAALLHDFMRVIDFCDFHPEKFPVHGSADDVAYWEKIRAEYSGIGHEEAAAKILRERGFTEEAGLIEQHRYRQVIEGFDSLEAKILYYADKRAKHDEIVPLAARLEEGRRRNVPETIGTPEAAAVDEKIFALEREIQSLGGI
ncbi:HDIG domain-containing protein [Candidatus Peregrinibacteria bacterium]|nr:HDIG domain-containing protein [Candidatus Peregrinibacteria bacterium]